MGFYIADNMNTESSMVALKNAVKNRKYTSLSLIHHSDRGLQYYLNDYQKYSKKQYNMQYDTKFRSL